MAEVEVLTAAYDAATAEYWQLEDKGSGASLEERQAASDRLRQIEMEYRANKRAAYEAAVVQNEMNTEPPPAFAELGELRVALVAARKELKRLTAIIDSPGVDPPPWREFFDAQYAEAMAEMRYQHGKNRFRERDVKSHRTPTPFRVQ